MRIVISSTYYCVLNAAKSEILSGTIEGVSISKPPVNLGAECMRPLLKLSIGLWPRL